MTLPFECHDPAWSDQRVQGQLDQLSEAVVTEVGNLNEAIRVAELPPVGA